MILLFTSVGICSSELFYPHTPYLWLYLHVVPELWLSVVGCFVHLLIYLFWSRALFIFEIFYYIAILCDLTIFSWPLYLILAFSSAFLSLQGSLSALGLLCCVSFYLCNFICALLFNFALILLQILYLIPCSVSRRSMSFWTGWEKKKICSHPKNIIENYHCIIQ